MWTWRPHLWPYNFGLMGICFEDIKRPRSIWVPVFVLNGEINNVRRASVVGTVCKVDGEVFNMARVQDSDVAVTKSFGRPQLLFSCYFPHDPFIISIENQMTVPTIISVAMLIDHLANEMHAFTRRARALQHNSREIRIL